MNESFNVDLDELAAVDSPVNWTDSFPEPEYHLVTTIIEKYSIPVLCLLGLCGNTLASFVFLKKALRNSSSSIFLATRGFSDNGFLTTLFIIWISRTFKLQLGLVAGACQVIIFLTYVCGCVSVWLVVFVTIENYVRICRPFIVKRVCKTSAAKLAVLILCILAAGIYNFPFWAMSCDVCIPLPEHFDLVQAFVYTDTVLTLIVPLMCITALMAAILCDLVKSYNRRSKLHAPTAKRVKNPMAKVTKMLLAVTITFFCLNLPSHINRLRLMISSFINDPQDSSASTIDEVAIQQITLFLSYLSLTINVFVYTIFGSKFRSVLLELIKCSCISSGNVGKRTNIAYHGVGNGNSKQHIIENMAKDICEGSNKMACLNSPASSV